MMSGDTLEPPFSTKLLSSNPDFDPVIRRQNFESTVPIRFDLADDECDQSNPTMTPLYLKVNRNHYFGMYVGSIFRHLSRFVLAPSHRVDPAKMWMYCDVDGFGSVMLKWQHPVGVAYDLLNEIDEDDKDNITNSIFKVNVHLAKNYPHEHLVELHSDDLMKSNFFYSIKESDMLYTNGRAVNSLREGDFRSLWNGVKSVNFEQYWCIDKRLVLWPNLAESKLNRHNIPLKIHSRLKGLTQTLIDKSKTVHDLRNDKYLDPQESSTIVNGISVDDDMCLETLWKNLSYADNFLHIVCRR